MTIHIIRTKRATFLIKVPLYIIYGTVFTTLLIAFFSFNVLHSTPTHAESLDYTVTIDPSLNISIPTNLLTLDLNPVSKTFDTKDLNVIVDTNNSNGYKLTMNTMAGSGGSDGTSLVNVLDSTKTIGTLPIVIGTTSGSSVTTYTEDTFPANKWGYKISARNSTTIPNSKYLPYISGTTIAMSSSLALQDTTTLTFASKVNYDQPAGLYAINLSFNGTINPISPPYMQNLNPDVCVEEHPTLVVDSRDNRSYYIQRLADHKCWMIQNLRLGQNLATTTGALILTDQDTNISANDTYNPRKEFVLTNKVVDGKMPIKVTDSGNIWDDSAFYCTLDYGCYYNFYTATAGIKSEGDDAVAAKDTVTTTSICPKGWVLPTGGNDGEFKTLVTEYSSIAMDMLVEPTTATGNVNGSFAPGLLLGGYYNNRGIDRLNDYGVYWGSNVSSATLSYDLIIRESGATYINVSNRYNGMSIRCLLQES